MKLLSLLLLSLIIIGLTNCKSQNKQNIDNKEYPIEITDNIRKIKEDNGYMFYLKNPQVFNTYPIKNKLLTDYDGNKMAFILAEDHVIIGDTIPVNSQLWLHSVEKPWLYILSKPTWIQGYFVGTEKITGKGNNVEFFAEESKIKWFMPGADIEIDEIPCKANYTIKLYQSGKLHIGTLSKDFEYQGKRYLANTRVFLDTNQLISPASVYNFGDSQIPWRFEFYDDGNPKIIMLDSDVTLDGVSYKRNFEVFFHPNGVLKEGVIAKKVKINEMEFKKGDKIQFDITGKILNNK